ncbi:MAG TPA: VWA domain-containing protein [Thermoanaerobaculia bacterium]
MQTTAPTPHPTPAPRVRSRLDRSRRAGVLAVAALAAITLGAKLVSRLADTTSYASLVRPGAPATAGDGRVTLGAAADRGAVLQGGDGLLRLQLTLAGNDVGGPARRLPTDFVVVLDHSGSMGGRKIVDARNAVAGLIDRLGPTDRFALVVYDSVVDVPIPLGVATPEARERWKAIAAQVEPRGGTALSLGLDAALDLVAGRRDAGAARVVLISDGLANEGDTTRSGLLGRASRATSWGVPVTAIGVGEDFDESLMGSLADAGSGNFYFLRDTVALAQVFEGELGATRQTVAEALAVEIEPGPGVVVVDAAGYPVERRGSRAVFRPGSLFAGQERRLWLTLRVPADELGARPLGTVLARYRSGGEDFAIEPVAAGEVATVADRAAYLSGIDRDRWERSVVEEEYGRLQQEVAEHVKAGRLAEAKEEIAVYKAKNEKLNASLGSQEVADNLEAVDALASEVDDAFVGPDQGSKQNRLSKARQASAWDGRRQGAKLPPASPKPGGGSN